MKIIKKFIMFIKRNINTKKIEEKKQTANNNTQTNFFNSIKIDTLDNKKKGKIETLVCEGDGLGIQKKITH